MIGAFEITIPDQVITGGEVEISLRTERQRMHSLVLLEIRQHRLTPQQPFRFDVRALQDGPFEHINRGVSRDVEICTADRNAVNPGIFGKTIQELARLIQSISGRLINKKRLATTGEQSPRAVELQRQKRLRCIGIDAHEL